MNATKKDICRLCHYETVDTTDIFNEKGIAFDYIGKIKKYLYFSVLEDDGLPKTVCWMCTQHLETFHRFYEKINDIQKKQLTEPEYERIVLHPKYESIKSSDNTSDLLSKNDIVVDDGSETYEVLLISDDFQMKHEVDSNEFEEFELLEVDEAVESQESAASGQIQKRNHETIVEQQDSGPKDTTEIQNEKSPKSTQTRSGRKLRSNLKHHIEFDSHMVRKSVRQAAKTKLDTKISEPNEKRCKQTANISVVKKEIPTNKSLKQSCETDNMQQDYDDVEGESDDEFPARDSDNEDWPSQETLNGFPKRIIRNGLLQVKGKELMSLICRFYNLECKMCEEKRRFKQLNDLLDHYTTAHKKAGYVECCQTKFSRYPAIIMHMARHLQPDAFKCDECGYIVTRPRFLQSHKQTHLPDDQKPYACNECPRRFCWKSALRIHLITHKPASERRQYVCHVCGRIYDTPGGLSTHKKLVHSGTRPPQSNVCHICAKNFSTRTGLQEHMVTIHQPREKGQMQCTECGKWLMNLRCLKTHMVLHSDAEFHCDQCDYVTKKRVLLNRHLVTQHSTDRPFVCDLCGRDFKMKRALTVHVAQHGSTTKYKCPFCTRTFNSSTNFYTHRKYAHPKELADMKRLKEESQRQKRIKAGVEEIPVKDESQEQDAAAKEIQPIQVQIDDEEETTTFHVTEIRDTHLILKTESGEEYTVLEVNSHDNNGS